MSARHAIPRPMLRRYGAVGPVVSGFNGDRVASYWWPNDPNGPAYLRQMRIDYPIDARILELEVEKQEAYGRFKRAHDEQQRLREQIRRENEP